jgi:SnoaL-like polyketide cyclase.
MAWRRLKQCSSAHVGDFAGVAPTGAGVRLPYSVVYDVSDGKIDQLRAYFPIMALVQQLKDAASVHA